MLLATVHRASVSASGPSVRTEEVSMAHTPLELQRVIADQALRDRVAKILSSIPRSARESHGITLHLKRKPRALVFWGEFPADADALAQRIRSVLGPKYEVSQVGPPEGWGPYRTATE